MHLCARSVKASARIQEATGSVMVQRFDGSSQWAEQPRRGPEPQTPSVAPLRSRPRFRRSRTSDTGVHFGRHAHPEARQGSMGARLTCRELPAPPRDGLLHHGGLVRPWRLVVAPGIDLLDHDESIEESMGERRGGSLRFGGRAINVAAWSTRTHAAHCSKPVTVSRSRSASCSMACPRSTATCSEEPSC